MADKANPYIGAARAAIGQGLGMGFGDEAEAFFRSKLGNQSYEDNLRKIRNEYAQYSKENPFTSGAAEFIGGVAPGVGMMLIPGAQAAGAAQIERSALGTMGRLAAMGAGTGAISGAGSATEGQRIPGAISGGAVGGALGAALPLGIRAGGGAFNFLKGRAFNSDDLAQSTAVKKLSGALRESGSTPQAITTQMALDRGMLVPSTVSNTNPALSDLAKAVAQRTGPGTRKIEDTLVAQNAGAKDRTIAKIDDSLQPGNYFEDLDTLKSEMKRKAAPNYEAAYSFGEVDDPEVLKFLELPQFKQGLGKARELLAAEGRTIPTVPIVDSSGAVTGERVAPTVEVLDQVKRGLDSLIESETDSMTGKTSSLGRIYVQKKNEFLDALDNAVPDYKTARSVYKGDAELAGAMKSGMEDFGKLKPEQITKLVGGMSGGEQEAFRTGVARNLYGQIMKPSSNFNSAQRIIGSPEMEAKLRPLFDNQASYDLFSNAMQRESQLFKQANHVLGGSPTAKNQFAREALDSDGGVGEAMLTAVTGGWASSLSSMAMNLIRKGQMNEKMTGKLADMLMAKDPHEVAAVVKMLEDFNTAAIPRAATIGAAEAGAVTGAASAISPAPEEDQPTMSIDDALNSREQDQGTAVQGSSIEDDLNRMMMERNR